MSWANGKTSPCWKVAAWVCCLVVPAVRTDTGQCVSSSEPGSDQISFQNSLQFINHLTKDLLNFKLTLHGDDDPQPRWFSFERSGDDKYRISTPSARTDLPVTEGQKTWTLSVKRDNYDRQRLLLTYGSSQTVKTTLPARPDFCYLLQLSANYNFDYKFCYPDSSNNCTWKFVTIPTTTTTPAATTTTTTKSVTTTVTPEPTTDLPTRTEGHSTEDPQTSSSSVAAVTTDITTTTTTKDVQETASTENPDDSHVSPSTGAPKQIHFLRIIYSVWSLLLIR